MGIHNYKYLQVDPSGEIILLSQSVPWAEHVFELEKEMDVQPPLKYLIFKDNNYRVRCVPVKPASFVARYLSRRQSSDLSNY